MSQNTFQTLLNRIQSLRRRASLANQDALFWADFLTTVLMVSGANAGVIIEQALDQDQPDWVPLSITNNDSLNQQVSILDKSIIEQAWFKEFARRSLQNTFSLHKEEGGLPSHYLAFKLQSSSLYLLVLKISNVESSKLSDLVMKVQLLTDIPYPSGSQETFVETDDNLRSVLAVLPSFFAVEKFDLAGYVLVNEFVGHCDELDQSVFGVVKGEYTRIQAISHFDRFEPKADLVKLYEAALEECCDQAEVIQLSQPKVGYIHQAHMQLQKALGTSDIISFPLFDEKGDVFAAILFTNMQTHFSQEFINTTNFVLSLLSTRLDYLRRKQLAWWIRLKDTVGKFLSILFGKEWLWTKFFTLLVIVVFSWVLLGSLPLRLESKGQFDTDQTQMIAAPQDGYILDVNATAGDLVEQNQILMNLKTQDMLLQMTEFLAEKQRYEAEEDKARAAFNFIDVEISKARKAQVEAKISRLELKLDEAAIKAPFDGVVVEGERKNLLGSPVKQGEKLMQIAKIEGIYLVMDVDERDLPLIQIGDQGEFALVSQPLDKINFRIEQIIPAASDSGKSSAHFKVKAKLLVDPAPWWRPGMIGVAKVDKGDAPVYWVLGRKTYHQLRLMLWW